MKRREYGEDDEERGEEEGLRERKKRTRRGGKEKVCKRPQRVRGEGSRKTACKRFGKTPHKSIL